MTKILSTQVRNITWLNTPKYPLKTEAIRSSYKPKQAVINI